MNKPMPKADDIEARYRSVFGDVSRIIDAARGSAARSVNAVMTAAYWMIGRHVVEFEQEGKKRADYGEEIVERLAADLSTRYGRGFSLRNVWQMKAFYLAWPILQTPSAESEDGEILQTVSAESSLISITSHFPLPWSAYVRLLSVKNTRAREFYEVEALNGGWSVRELDRQINSQFYERTALSKNKAAMLTQGRLLAQKIHGIDRKRMDKEGIPFPEAFGRLAGLIRDAQYVFAWNAEFDRRLLRQTCKRHGLRLPSVVWRCAMQEYALSFGGYGTGAASAKNV